MVAMTGPLERQGPVVQGPAVSFLGWVGGISPSARSMRGERPRALRAPAGRRRVAARKGPRSGIATRSQPERWGDAQAAMSRSSRDVQDEPLPVSFLDRYLIDARPRVGD